MIVAAAIASALVLAGCGSKGTPAAGGTASTAVVAGQATTAATTKAKPTCDMAPASLVNSVLGTNVAAAAAQNLGAVVVCRYSPASGSGSVVVRVQTDMSATAFKEGRAISDANGMPTTDLPGFADQAYTNVLKAGTHVTNTVIALKGTTQLIVASPATFAAEMSLEDKLFAAFG